MLVRDVLFSIRTLLKDTAKSRYSDVELIEHLNNAVETIAIMRIGVGDSQFLKTTSLAVPGGSVSLPDDFEAVFSIRSNDVEFSRVPENVVLQQYQYKIIGDTLFSSSDVTISYFSIPAALSDEEDTFPLQRSYSKLAIQIVEFIAKSREAGETASFDDIESKFGRSARMVGGRRTFNKIGRPTPFSGIGRRL